MKKKSILISSIVCASFFFACKEKTDQVLTAEYAGQAHLDSLKTGLIDYGDDDINKASINLLNFQKKYKTGETNGTVIPKEHLTQAINGFTETGINVPTDTSNYNKWDFLVVYPGVAISEQGEESPTTCVFYYKGALNAQNKLIPVGNPVKGIKFMGGGGGPGDAARTTPPPTLP